MADTKTFTAADVLLYLFSDCEKWTEDVDGDARDGGTPYAIVNHDIRLSEYHRARRARGISFAGHREHSRRCGPR